MEQIPLQQLALHAFDLSERSWQIGRDVQRRGVKRWLDRAWMITQAAVTAGLAWYFAQIVLGQQAPVFAAVAAILTIGSSFGQRMSRAVEVAVGVALGVFFGDLFVMLFGRGGWQIIAAVFIAMSVATIIGTRNLMIAQAGVQAVVVIVIPFADGAFSRWIDAVVGCVVALLVAIIAPTGPIRKPALLAAAALRECADVIAEIRTSLTERDVEAGERILGRARAISDRMTPVDEATDEGVAVARASPFLRKRRNQLLDLSASLQALDRLTRNIRVLARRGAVALWYQEEVPEDYLKLMDGVAVAVGDCSAELAAGRVPVETRERVIRLGAAHSNLKLVNSISAVVILAQLRSILVDLLEITGMSYADARSELPDTH